MTDEPARLPSHSKMLLLAPSVWDRDPGLPRAQGLSLLAHLLAVTLLFTLFAQKARNENGGPDQKSPWEVLIYRPPAELRAVPKPAGGGGSGGENNPQPPTHGVLPPFSSIQIVPPALSRNDDPQLAAQPNLLGDPAMQPPQIAAPNWGIPQMKEFTDSNGPGHGSGQGNKCCGGSGLDGDGRGYGPGEQWGMGGGVPKAGELGVGYPRCEYCPNPAYSEEARKQKYQGIVLLRATITTDGRAVNIRVIKGLGLGLDEKAIEAVRDWRFQPALGPDGRPAVVWLPIEIRFRIY